MHHGSYGNRRAWRMPRMAAVLGGSTGAALYRRLGVTPLPEPAEGANRRHGLRDRTSPATASQAYSLSAPLFPPPLGSVAAEHCSVL